MASALSCDAKGCVWLGVGGGVLEVGLTQGGGGVSLELSLGIRDRSESNLGDPVRRPRRSAWA